MEIYLRVMCSVAGRILRIVAGASLVFAGMIWDHHGSLVWLLVLPGMLFILSSLMNLCLLGPLFGYPLFGAALRRSINERRQVKEMLNELTFVGDRLRRYPPTENHD
jgi:hypothetical protein